MQYDIDETHESLIVDSVGEVLGPYHRNLKIWDLKILKLTNDDEWKERPKEERKTVLKIHQLMKKEFSAAVKDTPAEHDGIAVLNYEIKNFRRGEISMLVLFHGGKLLFIETLSKVAARSCWKESVKKSDLVKLETKRDFDNFAHKTHFDNLKAPKYVSISACVGQGEERFNTNSEEDDSKICWMCAVPVKCLKKSLCSGCLRARYCSMECLEGDWAVHGDWCQMRRERREEKEMIEKMVERARRDIEQDNSVD